MAVWDGTGGSSPVPDASGGGHETIKAVVAGWLGVVLIAGAVGAFLLSQHFVAETSIGLAALEGLVLLTLSLAGLIIVSKALGISRRNAALGLPPGSVRALLAFSLVLIFVSVSSWTLKGFIDTVSFGGVVLSETVKAEDRDAKVASLRGDYPDSSYIIIARQQGTTQTYRLDVRLRVDSAFQQQILDLAKQIMTIVATVLVTVVGFYFGSNSAADAVKSAGEQIVSTQRALAGGDAPSDTPSPTGIGRSAAEIRRLANDMAARFAELGPAPLAEAQAAIGTLPDGQSEAGDRLAQAQQSLEAMALMVASAAKKADEAETIVKGVRAASDAETLQHAAVRVEALTADVRQISSDFRDRMADFARLRAAIQAGPAARAASDPP